MKIHEQTFISCHDPLLGNLCLGNIAGEREANPRIQGVFENLMGLYQQEEFFMHYFEDYVTWNYLFTIPNPRASEFAHKIMVSLVVDTTTLKNDPRAMMQLFSRANQYRSQFYAMKQYFLRNTVFCSPSEQTNEISKSRMLGQMVWFEDVNRYLRKTLERRTWQEECTRL